MASESYFQDTEYSKFQNINPKKKFQIPYMIINHSLCPQSFPRYNKGEQENIINKKSTCIFYTQLFIKIMTFIMYLINS